MIKQIKKISKIVFISVLLLIFIIASCHVWVEQVAHEREYNQVQGIPKNKVGLVLGTSKYLSNGARNLFFKYRIDGAVELYEAGKIEYVLVSGDNKQSSYNEPRDMFNELVKRGIPSNKIVLDYAGFRTLDSVLRAHKVFGQKAFTIITQQFHNERAIFIGVKKGLDVIGYNLSLIHI